MYLAEEAKLEKKGNNELSNAGLIDTLSGYCKILFTALVSDANCNSLSST